MRNKAKQVAEQCLKSKESFFQKQSFDTLEKFYQYVFKFQVPIQNSSHKVWTKL